MKLLYLPHVPVCQPLHEVQPELATEQSGRMHGPQHRLRPDLNLQNNDGWKWDDQYDSSNA